MPEPTPSIGGVNLDQPLAWQNKPVASLGSGKIGADIRTLTGDMVFITGKADSGPAKPVEATFLFFYERQATIDALNALWDAGQTVSADFEGDGASYQFRFDVEKGISDVTSAAYGDEAVYAALEGGGVDLYKGKITGYILSGL